MITVFRRQFDSGLFPFKIAQAENGTATGFTLSLANRNKTWRETAIRFLEVLSIFLLIIAYCGQRPPDVNESHYLVKAKHFWNPEFCPEDLFLSSANSHWLFYFCFGWLTKFVSLETFAWTGRLINWLAISIIWRRLSWIIIPTPFIAPLTAGVFFIFNARFHLAGEWVIGGFEAKSVAYVLLLWGLSEITVRRWKLVWLILGLAAAFHLLVGGWGLIAAGWVWLAERRYACQIRWNRPPTFREWLRESVSGLKSQLVPIGIALGLVIFAGAWPLAADWNSDAETKRMASQIYVHERLAHHLLFSAFPVANIARFFTLVGVWLLLKKFSTRLIRVFEQFFFGVNQFVMASLSMSFVGLWLSAIATEQSDLSDLTTSLLRFYWFRLADFAVPLATCLTMGSLISQWLSQSAERFRKYAAGFAVLMITSAGLVLAIEKQNDSRPIADQRSLPRFNDEPEKNLQYLEKWVQVCQWISFNTPADAKFLTPHQQQTFKWYAGRNEIVNWKDLPQDARSIVQWRNRVDEVIVPQQQYELGLMSFSDDQLRELANRYGARYLLVPQWQVDLAGLSKLKQVYPPSTATKAGFVVFEF